MPIDVHAHYVPSRIIATLEERAGDFGLSLVKTPPQCAIHFDYGLKVRPFFQKLIEPVEQLLNESLSELCQKHPERFALFASVPLPDAAGAAREAEFAMNQLGAAGIVVA